MSKFIEEFGFLTYILIVNMTSFDVNKSNIDMTSFNVNKSKSLIISSVQTAIILFGKCSLKEVLQSFCIKLLISTLPFHSLNVDNTPC